MFDEEMVSSLRDFNILVLSEDKEDEYLHADITNIYFFLQDIFLWTQHSWNPSQTSSNTSDITKKRKSF